LQVCLNQEEGGATIDVQAAAVITPETYTPSCSLTFKVIARGGGFRNTFGWYNVNPSGKPANSDLHSFLECSDGVGTVKELDIAASPFYEGGEIGFFMATPEGTCCNCPTFDPNGGPEPGTVGYIYYSERQYNPDNVGADSFIHLITYKSVTYANSFYFAWEDLLAGGDNDFDDLLTRVSGIWCSGGGDACDTGFDGRCSFGTMQCRNGGALDCVQNELPGTETCNGVDDDCNGQIDEGDLCPPDRICHRGSCVPVCGGGEFSCPLSLVCNSDGICVDPECLTVTCPEGEICVHGECRGWCDGVQCPHGQVCRAGACVDPCAEVTCDTDYVCELGVCLLRCTCGQCESGKVCNVATEHCVPDGCENVSCEAWQHCEGGVCVDNCVNAACPTGETCEQGACVASDPDAGTGGGLADGGLFDGGLFDDGGGTGTSGSGGDGYAGGTATGDDEGGCGCRATRSGSPWGIGGLLALAAASLVRRRRRTHHAAARECASKSSG
jgi:MYXO-CTERM domain-containing protein